MTDEKLVELLQSTKDEIIRQVRVEIETNVTRQLKLLAEGHEMLLERMPDVSELYALKERVKILESVVKQHSIEINSLKKAT